MSKLHRPESLIRRKDSDFMDERGHWWFAFDCPSESRAAERHHHDYLVRDDGAEARCSCPYADWDKRACTLVLCARDIARAEREREAAGPPADPGGATRDAAQADMDTEQKDWILGGKLSPPPWLVAPSERKRRYDEAMRLLYGD